MTIQLAIDDTLINEARVLGHFESKEDTVINALREFISHHKKQRILKKNNEIIFGVLEGSFIVPENFDAPLPKIIEDDFYKTSL
jgi:hypothetical protein